MRLYTWPLISDMNTNLLRLDSDCNMKGRIAEPSHSLHTIGQNIHQNLFQLNAVRQNSGGLFRQLQSYFNPLLLTLVFHYTQRVQHEFINLHQLVFARAFTAEIFKLSDNHA